MLASLIATTWVAPSRACAVWKHSPRGDGAHRVWHPVTARAMPDASGRHEVVEEPVYDGVEWACKPVYDGVVECEAHHEADADWENPYDGPREADADWVTPYEPHNAAGVWSSPSSLSLSLMDPSTQYLCALSDFDATMVDDMPLTSFHSLFGRCYEPAAPGCVRRSGSRTVPRLPCPARAPPRACLPCSLPCPPPRPCRS